MTKYSKHLTTTPQSEPILGSKQVKNNAGGFVYEIDDFGRLDRFLILGSEGGSYYVGEKKLTRENAAAVARCIAADGLKTVKRISEISDSGRAPKNDPAIFALALCLALGNEETKKAARAAIPVVCRIGTHLFDLVNSIGDLKVGWGRGTRKAFARWYTEQDTAKLAYGLIKYQSRNGVAHADVLRLSHAEPKNDVMSDLFRWSIGHFYDQRVKVQHPKHGTILSYQHDEAAKEGFLKKVPADKALQWIWAFEKAKAATTDTEIVSLITEYGLPRECIPTQFLNSVGVWEALLDNKGKGMPITALVRNLAKMTAIGLIAPLSAGSKRVVALLSDTDAIRSARIHPMQILLALRTYEQGHGDKGSLTWSPVTPVVNALDDAFYRSFKYVEPTGKNRLIALDVSGSMGGAQILGTPLTAREASAALAMITIATEQNYHVVGFTSGAAGEFRFGSGGSRWAGYASGLTEIDLSPKMKLTKAIEKISSLPMGGTDCALPMLYAAAKKLEVDAFEVYTDNETWAGTVHPSEALRRYRKEMGRPAKLIVNGMTATQFSIADPNDAGMMDVVGFDSAAPSLMADFIRS
jgi:60 kDa SS-A/Ro ribonucleoprotein